MKSVFSGRWLIMVMAGIAHATPPGTAVPARHGAVRPDEVPPPDSLALLPAAAKASVR